jgi:hypothetical protein
MAFLFRLESHRHGARRPTASLQRWAVWPIDFQTSDADLSAVIPTVEEAPVLRLFPSLTVLVSLVLMAAANGGWKW